MGSYWNIYMSGEPYYLNKNLSTHSLLYLRICIVSRSFSIFTSVNGNHIPIKLDFQGIKCQQPQHTYNKLNNTFKIFDQFFHYMFSE